MHATHAGPLAWWPLDHSLPTQALQPPTPPPDPLERPSEEFFSIALL